MMLTKLSVSFKPGYNAYACMWHDDNYYIWQPGSSTLAVVGTWNDARVDACDIVLPGNGGVYEANFPTTAPVGIYHIQYFIRDGSVPTTTDYRIGGLVTILWNGSTYEIISANKILVSFRPGQDLYTLLYRGVDSFIKNVDTSAFEAIGTWNDARVDACDIVLTDAGGGLYYDANNHLSSITSTGIYYAVYLHREGNDPLTSDPRLGSPSKIEVAAAFHSSAKLMVKSDIVDWLKTELLPRGTVTPDGTIEQIVDNSVRYWNTHSAVKTTTMVDFVTAQTRVQLNASFKDVISVYPANKTTLIWNDHPMWSLLGISIIDNLTGDLMLISEAFKNYQIYVGTNMQWHFQRSQDPAVGGYLYVTHSPTNSSKLAVVGTRRITAADNIDDDYILDWILAYSLALLKEAEGRTLRGAQLINAKTDGSDLVSEGREEKKILQEQLRDEGRWAAFAQRS